MSEQRDDEKFKVVIYANEYRQICAWVLEQEYLETGGDLFGLWKDDHTAVIQLALGPGKNCRRASASFYQDVNYLEKTGSQLIKKEGVCHIGEWHSHHKIGLNNLVAAIKEQSGETCLSTASIALSYSLPTLRRKSTLQLV